MTDNTEEFSNDACCDSVKWADCECECEAVDARWNVELHKACEVARG